MTVPYPKQEENYRILLWIQLFDVNVAAVEHGGDIEQLLLFQLPYSFAPLLFSIVNAIDP